MSETLFDLTGEYRQVYEMLTDPEMDEQMINDTLEGIMGAIEVKSAGYVAIINQLKMEADACKEHEAIWKAKKQVRENSMERLKKRLADSMVAIDKKEIPAGDVTIKLQKNGGQLPLIIDDDATIPDRFKKIIYETDKALIRKALDEGEELDFARLGERGSHIVIK